MPLPASYEVMSAWQQIQVTNDSGQGDGFQITFNLARGVADYGLIQNGTVAPMKRIVIGVLFGALPEVLIDGVITHHQFNPGTQPGQATLTVTGRDLTTFLDLEEKNEEFPNQPDFLIATKVLAAYAKYGIVPVPTPTTDFPIMLQRIPRQQETDLALFAAPGPAQRFRVLPRAHHRWRQSGLLWSGESPGAAEPACP